MAFILLESDLNVLKALDKESAEEMKRMFSAAHVSETQALLTPLVSAQLCGVRRALLVARC